MAKGNNGSDNNRRHKNPGNHNYRKMPDGHHSLNQSSFTKHRREGSTVHQRSSGGSHAANASDTGYNEQMNGHTVTEPSIYSRMAQSQNDRLTAYRHHKEKQTARNGNGHVSNAGIEGLLADRVLVNSWGVGNLFRVNTYDFADPQKRFPKEDENNKKKFRVPPLIWLLPVPLALLLLKCPSGPVSAPLTGPDGNPVPGGNKPVAQEKQKDCWAIAIPGASPEEMEMRQRIASIAALHIGKHEIPDQNNFGEVVEYALKGKQGYAYCTAWAARVLEEAAPGLIPYTWYSGKLAKEARKSNAYYTGEKHRNFIPKPGDILITRLDDEAKKEEGKEFHTRIVLCLIDEHNGLPPRVCTVSANTRDKNNPLRPEGVYAETMDLGILQEAIAEGITGAIDVGKRLQQQKSLQNGGRTH